MSAHTNLYYLHTTLCVRNLEASRSFYGELLGLQEITERPLSFPGLWYDLGNAQLHLILDPGFHAPIASSDAWGRSPHLALSVPDLSAIQQRIMHRGITYQASASGRAALFVRDPDGNTIELSQRSSEALT